MTSLAVRATREVWRRELLPERALWWLAAEGMRDWYRVLAKQLAPHLKRDSKELLSELSVRMFARRGEILKVSGRDLALLMGALYRVDHAPKARWIFAAMGRSANGAGEVLRARVLLAKMRPFARWNEVATHLGELLIVLTEDLPPHLDHARKVLGDICFESGAKYAGRVKKMMSLHDSPAAAMEVLRMSEYVFRVNPEHWQHDDGTSGWLEGTACPWYERPGWNGAHCGIFGQFQSGIASVFGLRYHLTKTIPRHGGHTCRIDVKPIQLRVKQA